MFKGLLIVNRRRKERKSISRWLPDCHCPTLGSTITSNGGVGGCGFGRVAHFHSFRVSPTLHATVVCTHIAPRSRPAGGLARSEPKLEYQSGSRRRSPNRVDPRVSPSALFLPAEGDRISVDIRKLGHTLISPHNHVYFDQQACGLGSELREPTREVCHGPSSRFQVNARVPARLLACDTGCL